MNYPVDEVMRERLITWGFRLGFSLVLLLTIYIVAFRS